MLNKQFVINGYTYTITQQQEGNAIDFVSYSIQCSQNRTRKAYLIVLQNKEKKTFKLNHFKENYKQLNPLVIIAGHFAEGSKIELPTYAECWVYNHANKVTFSGNFHVIKQDDINELDKLISQTEKPEKKYPSLTTVLEKKLPPKDSINSHSKFPAEVIQTKDCIPDGKLEEISITENLTRKEKNELEIESIETYLEAKKHPKLASSMKLRDFQRETLGLYLEKFKEFCQKKSKSDNLSFHCVFPCPTGWGKTVFITTFSVLIKYTLLKNQATIKNQPAKKIIIIAPRVNLIKQTKATFKRIAPDVKLFLLNKTKWNLLEMKKSDVTVMTVQAYQQHAEDGDEFHKIFDTLIIDEAHNMLSSERQAIVKKRMEEGYTIYALTATPKTHEGNVYTLLRFDPSGSDNPIPEISPTKTIDIGANCPVITGLVKLPGYENIKARNPEKERDYSESDMKKFINTETNNRTIVDLYFNGFCEKIKTNFRGIPGIIFSAGVQHAIELAKCFNETKIELVDPDKKWSKNYQENVEAYFVTKERTKHPDRKSLDNFTIKENTQNFLKKHPFQVACAVYAAQGKKYEKIDSEKLLKVFKLGGFLIGIGSDIFIEGFDHVDVAWGLICRPTGYDHLIKQMFGRIFRINPNDPNKIAIALQLVVGNSKDAAYYWDHISTLDAIRFNYGLEKVQLPTAIPQLTKVPVLNVNERQAQIQWAPADAEILIRKVEKRHRTRNEFPIKTFNEHVLKEKTSDKTSIAANMQDMLSELEKLENLMIRLEDKPINMDTTIQSEPEPPEFPKNKKNTVATSETTLLPPSLATSNPNSTEKILKTRQLTKIFNGAREKIKSISKLFVVPSQFQSNNIPDFPARIQTSSKDFSVNEELRNLTQRCKTLQSLIGGFFKGSVIGYSGPSNSDAGNIVGDLETLTKDLKQITDYIEKNRESAKKQFSQKGEKANFIKIPPEEKITPNKEKKNINLQEGYKPYVEQYFEQGEIQTLFDLLACLSDAETKKIDHYFEECKKYKRKKDHAAPFSNTAALIGLVNQLIEKFYRKEPDLEALFEAVKKTLLPFDTFTKGQQANYLYLYSTFRNYMAIVLSRIFKKVSKNSPDFNFINKQDKDGNSLLHLTCLLATNGKSMYTDNIDRIRKSIFDILLLLITQKRTKISLKNNDNLTALDILFTRATDKTQIKNNIQDTKIIIFIFTVYRKNVSECFNSSLLNADIASLLLATYNNYRSIFFDNLRNADQKNLIDFHDFNEIIDRLFTVELKWTQYWSSDIPSRQFILQIGDQLKITTLATIASCLKYMGNIGIHELSFDKKYNASNVHLLSNFLKNLELSFEIQPDFFVKFFIQMLKIQNCSKTYDVITCSKKYIARYPKSIQCLFKKFNNSSQIIQIDQEVDEALIFSAVNKLMYRDELFNFLIYVCRENGFEKEGDYFESLCVTYKINRQEINQAPIKQVQSPPPPAMELDLPFLVAVPSEESNINLLTEEDNSALFNINPDQPITLMDSSENSEEEVSPMSDVETSSSKRSSSTSDVSEEDDDMINSLFFSSSKKKRKKHRDEYSRNMEEDAEKSVSKKPNMSKDFPLLFPSSENSIETAPTQALNKAIDSIVESIKLDIQQSNLEKELRGLNFSIAKKISPPKQAKANQLTNFFYTDEVDSDELPTIEQANTNTHNTPTSQAIQTDRSPK